MANVRATNINYTSARAVIENLAFTANYYELFEVELWDYNLNTYFLTNSWIDSSSVNTYTSFDFSGLGEGTGYAFKAFAKSGGNRNFVGSYSFTTLSTAPPGSVGNISVVSHETSLDISWGNATNAAKYALEVRVGNSGGALVYSNYNLLGTSQTVSGLTSGTTYYIKVYAINTNNVNGTSSETTASTSRPRPTNWTWNSLVSSNTTYTNGKLRANLVFASEWNSFVSRINDFRIYKGLPVTTFTTAIASTDFTSLMFDEAYNSISAMTSVSNPVGFYSKLVALNNALNSI